MSKAKLFIMAIIGVLAFSAASSSMASANWMVNGTNLVGTAALARTAAVDEKGTLTVANAEIICSGSTLKGENPVINASTEMGDASSLEFTQCKGNEPVCILGSSTVKTLPILVDLTLEGSSPATGVLGRFLAANTSKLFATIKFEGSECALKGVQPVKGSQAVFAPTGQSEQSAQEVEAVSRGEGLTVGGSAATLKGAILVRLESGLPFSFL